MVPAPPWIANAILLTKVILPQRRGDAELGGQIYRTLVLIRSFKRLYNFSVEASPPFARRLFWNNPFIKNFLLVEEGPQSSLFYSYLHG